MVALVLVVVMFATGCIKIWDRSYEPADVNAFDKTCILVGGCPWPWQWPSSKEKWSSLKYEGMFFGYHHWRDERVTLYTEYESGNWHKVTVYWYTLIGWNCEHGCISLPRDYDERGGPDDVHPTGTHG